MAKPLADLAGLLHDTFSYAMRTTLRRAQNLLHLGPWVGLAGVAGEILRADPVVDRGLERRPRAHTLVPCRDAGALVPQARQLEPVEAPDVRRRRDVGV